MLQVLCCSLRGMWTLANAIIFICPWVLNACADTVIALPQKVCPLPELRL